MKPSITFESWSAVNDDIGTLAECERKRMSVPWRIWEISIARANNWGHAAFRTGELVRLVCGSDNRSDRAAVNRGLKVLAAMGRIAPLRPNGSTLYCVMVNRNIAQRAAGKGSRKDMCSEPTHMDARETPFSPNTMGPAFMPSPYETINPSADDPWAEDDGTSSEAA